MITYKKSTWKELPAWVFLEMAKARKRHFIDRFEWDIPTYVGGQYEIDQFDAESAIYVWFIDFRNPHRILGSFRVLPHSASMTREIWPQFYPLIHPDSYEVSRACVHVNSMYRMQREDIQKSMQRWMHDFSERKYGANIYGCADRRTLALWRAFYNTTAKSILLDPDGDPDRNIAIWH